MDKMSILVGSVYGNAQHVAEEVNNLLQTKGLPSNVLADPAICDFNEASAILIISSTTGQGDIPPNLECFIQDLRDQFPLMEKKPFAVVALGDSSYGDTYCMAGRQIFELLIELQGQPIAELFEVDACETLEPETEVLAWAETLIPRLI